MNEKKIDYVGVWSAIVSLNELLKNNRECLSGNECIELAVKIKENLNSDLSKLYLIIQNEEIDIENIADIINSGKYFLELTKDLNGLNYMMINSIVYLRGTIMNIVDVYEKDDRQKQIDTQKQKIKVLQEIFNSDEAKKLLEKTITAGLCNSDYKWSGTKALLSYFADKASEYLKLGKGEYDGKPKTTWKPFESLFGINGLSGAKRDYQKTGTLPNGYEDVDSLFEQSI